MNNKHPTDKILLPAVFVAGFSIMGVEITASRLLAPYFGSSLFIWTNIIGVVMVALSLGYYYGGKIADRNPDFNILLILFLAAGSIFLLIPFITKPLSSLVLSQLLALDSGSIILFTSSLFVTTILFAFPLFLLAMTSPFVIRLSEIKKTNAGTTSGKVFAVSTIGSIIGTFLPTLWMIPTLGTRITIFTFAAILIVISLLGLVRNKVYLLGLAVLLLPVVVLAKQNIKPSPNLIAEDESAYQYIQIIKEDGARYMRYNEGGGVQSIYDKDKIMTGYYYDYYNLLPYLFPEEKRKDIAVIGLAGGTISRQMNHFFDNIHIDGVEIDPEVIRMAKKYMGLNPDNVDLHKRDGRMF
ncbi:MAG: fused MFS/spermidine synthase, partial [Candidatus Magasanikbacteria bacterium]